MRRAGKVGDRSSVRIRIVSLSSILLVFAAVVIVATIISGRRAQCPVNILDGPRGLYAGQFGGLSLLFNVVSSIIIMIEPTAHSHTCNDACR